MNFNELRKFFVCVEGDVMEPAYLDGDQVLFSIDEAEREGVVDGKSYFVLLKGGRRFFRRVFVDPDDADNYILRAWNESYEPIQVPRASVKLLAKAMSALRDVERDVVGRRIPWRPQPKRRGHK